MKLARIRAANEHQESAEQKAHSIRLSGIWAVALTIHAAQF
jgi:hypothetical protein